MLELNTGAIAHHAKDLRCPCGQVYSNYIICEDYIVAVHSHATTTDTAADEAGSHAPALVPHGPTGCLPVHGGSQHGIPSLGEAAAHASSGGARTGRSVAGRQVVPA